MKKKYVYIILSILVVVVAILLVLFKESDALKFKKEYEALNGKVNSANKEHRSVSIDKDNPFVYITPEDLIKRIENEETLYVYFGSKSCPWCRSVIEKTIEVANSFDIETIYYVDIWDDEGNEILRDKYKLDDNNSPVVVSNGSESYNKLLLLFDNVLTSYTLTDSEGNLVNVGEKRIYAPNFIYVENGKGVKLTEVISSKQEDSRGELTEEILSEQEDTLKEFFSTDNTCDIDSRC